MDTSAGRGLKTKYNQTGQGFGGMSCNGGQDGKMTAKETMGPKLEKWTAESLRKKSEITVSKVNQGTDQQVELQIATESADDKVLEWNWLKA